MPRYRPRPTLLRPRTSVTWLAWSILACTPTAERPPGRQSTDLATLEAQFPGAHLTQGRTVYMRQCISCHQADGQGTGRAIPPLVDHAPKLAAEAQGRAYLARLGLYGLTGRIEVMGQAYYNLMPAQGLALADEDVAGVLNYVLTQWGNDAAIEPRHLVLAEDVARERVTRRSAADNLAFRREALPGIPTPP